MPFDPTQRTERCPLCGSSSNQSNLDVFDKNVDCSLCGDFRISTVTVDEVGLPLTAPKKLALARHLLYKMRTQQPRPTLNSDFFKTLDERHLPTPAEACDNLIQWFAKKSDYMPGPRVFCDYGGRSTWAEIGLIDERDLEWVVRSLKDRSLLQGAFILSGFQGNLTAGGWERFEELRRAHVSSNYAFFARKFQNEALDEIVEKCLRPAVKQTGFDLHTVTPKAGLIDAIIEDEIRRCKFLLVDLSDDNAGAYWEAGFAEGLGKPVIYVCCDKTADGSEKKTHFDTDHRQTVRWNLASPDSTAEKLKAVIRNTLFGDAKQDD